MVGNENFLGRGGVAEFWPEFAQSGKAEITVGQLLSHSGGLSAFDERVDVLDYARVVAALERQAPLWPPGTAHGYHARTFGFLLDELVRRIAGVPLGEYWDGTFRRPMELDVWIGLRQRSMRASPRYTVRKRASRRSRKFYRDLATAGTLVRRTFTSPAGLHAVSGMNAAEIRSLANASFGGMGSAAGLAKFYAMLAAGGEWNGRRYFKAETIAQMTTTLASGIDLIFQIPTAFSAGFMKDAPANDGRIFGPSKLAFGHPGAGGSHAFADPEHGIAFAYVMNQMEQSLLPNERSLALVDGVYASS